MRQIFVCLLLTFLLLPGLARASSPGGACTVLGAQERDGGQLLICNGSVWVETIKTINPGRSLFQVGGSNGITCNATTAGRLRYGTALPSGLVGYWPMDESSGTSVADASGNGNTGTMTNMDGATDHVAGKFGNGLDFDGTNEYVNAGSAAILDDLGDMTVCAWVYYRGTGSGTYGHVVAKYDAGGGSTGGWDLYWAGEGVSKTGRGYKEITPSPPAPTNAWNHYCATIADTGTNGSGHTIYKNGAVLGPVVTSTYGTLGSDAAYNLFIGNYNDTAEPLDGIVDEVRVYDRALTVGEVQSIYNYNGSSDTGDGWQYCNGSTWESF